MSAPFDDAPIQPTLSRDARPRQYAPEVMHLIESGVLDDQLNVCRGWVETRINSVRRFVRAPTVKDMKMAYRRAKHRQIHTVRLSDETVMDAHQMDVLWKILADDKFEELSRELELMVACLVREQADPE